MKQTEGSDREIKERGKMECQTHRVNNANYSKAMCIGLAFITTGRYLRQTTLQKLTQFTVLKAGTA